MASARPSPKPVQTPHWRWLAGCLGILVLACGGSHADVPHQKSDEDGSALPLPRWSEQEIRAFRENLSGAGGLLPATEDTTSDISDLLTAPLTFGPRLDQGNASPEMLPRLRAEDMRLFLPESLLTQAAPPQITAPAQPTALSALKEVPAEFLAAGTAALPKEYLIDPAMLVTEMQQQEMLRFLDFHNHDAVIKLHVLILPGDRKLPANANLDAMCSGTLARGRACLLVYPLGEPWRARLFLSKAVHDQASQAFMQETARACVEEALHSSDEHDQLRSYAVELSTRLFWLQKALGTAPGSLGAERQPLAEISPDGTTAAQSPQGQGFPLLATGMLVGLMATGMLSRPLLRRLQQWLRLRRQNRVWMLPEIETVPRLGGAFTGGGGGMLRYAKPTVS